MRTIGLCGSPLASCLSASLLALMLHSIFDCPEQIQTSPTRTFLSSILLLPLIVNSNGPPASPEGIAATQRPSSPAWAEAVLPRNETVTFSPLSASPQILTLVFC